MKIQQYDKVILKDGDYAYIVEIFEDGKAFLADIDRKDGTETDWLKPEDIEKVVN
jgi:hypothetical protein